MPEQIGFSDSLLLEVLRDGLKEGVWLLLRGRLTALPMLLLGKSLKLELMLFRGAATLEVSASGGLDIAAGGESERDPAVAALRANIVFESEDPKDNEALGEDSASPGLSDLVESAAEDVAVEVLEENGEKTEPSTRLAFSLDASFLSSRLNLEGFLGSLGVGGGRRSNGIKPAGRRVICMVCGRRARGLQGGTGSLAGSDFCAAVFGVAV